MVGELGSISRVLNDPRRLCTCGREYSQCPIWGRIRPRLGRFALPTSAVNEGQSRLIFDNRGMLSEIGLAFGHGGLIVDTSKKISRLKYLAAEGINTKVIHLVKDPQTVVLSERRSAQRKATAQDGISLPNFSPKENGRAIFNWIEKQSRLKHAVKVLGLPCLIMRFEDWVGQRVAQSARLSSFLEMEIDITSPLVDFTSQHHLGGNNVRFSGEVTLRSEPVTGLGLVRYSRSNQAHIKKGLESFNYEM
jgi:hypothetical protein